MSSIVIYILSVLSVLTLKSDSIEDDIKTGFICTVVVVALLYLLGIIFL